MHRQTESVIDISVVIQNRIELMLCASLGVYGRKTGFYSWVWCLVGRTFKRVSFVRKSANVACIVEKKWRTEAGLSSKRKTGIILYLQQHFSVSRKRQGNADIGKTSEEHRKKCVWICKCRVFSLMFKSRIRNHYHVWTHLLPPQCVIKFNRRASFTRTIAAWSLFISWFNQNERQISKYNIFQ